MKNSWIILLLIASCGTTKPIPQPIPVPIPVPPVQAVVYDTTHIHVTVFDTTSHWTIFEDTAHIAAGWVSVADFGAKVDGKTDDFIADSTACAFAITHPWFTGAVVFPVGHSIISKPLILQNNGAQFTVHLKGVYPAKEAPDAYLSEIDCNFKSGPGIGIINGRGIIIENLAIKGQYQKPYLFTNKNIGTALFSDWMDSTITDTRYWPYAGISIDPYAGYAGTSGVEIKQCSIKQFMVGIAFSANGSTTNDEMINMDDDDIEAVRVAFAICQDQSKEIHINRFKCWSSTHTIIDGITYGRGTGGGSVMIEGMNIAGNVNELFNLNTDRFPLSCKDIYSESLFRIGNVGNGAGANFVNCSIDFLTGRGLPAADYLINGQANFYGGCFRYYDNQQTHRLNLSNFTGTFRDLTLNNPPIIVGLYGAPNQTCTFDNVHNYYHGGTVAVNDALTSFHTTPTTIDKVNWIASIVVPDDIISLAKVGDYILGTPCSQCRAAYDPYLNPQLLNTIQVGRIISISGDTLKLDDVAINALPGIPYDQMYLDQSR